VRKVGKCSVAAVVVTYNRKDLLRGCLRALLAQTRPLDEIIVIDNASTDGTDQMISKEFPQVTYVRLPENTGGAGGFSEGMKIAYTKGYDWIWVMDDDVSAENNCLERLLSYGNRQALILQPVRVFQHNDYVDLPAKEFDFSNLFRFGPYKKKSWKDLYPTIDSLPDTLVCSDIAFEGALIHRDLVTKIGFPEKGFFICWDDTEYGLRARRYTQILLVSSARLFRHNPREIQSVRCFNWKSYYALRNMTYIDRIYGQNVLVRHFRPLLHAGLSLMRSLLCLRWAELGMKAKAFYDGYLGRLGRKVEPGWAAGCRRDKVRVRLCK